MSSPHVAPPWHQTGGGRSPLHNNNEEHHAIERDDHDHGEAPPLMMNQNVDGCTDGQTGRNNVISQNGSAISLTPSTQPPSSLLVEEHKSTSVDNSNAITNNSHNNSNNINNITNERRDFPFEEERSEGLGPSSLSQQTTLGGSQNHDSIQLTFGAGESNTVDFARPIPDSGLSATASIFQATTSGVNWSQQLNSSSDPSSLDFYETQQPTEQQQAAWDNRPTMGYSNNNNMTSGSSTWGLQGTQTSSSTSSDSKMEAASSPSQQQRPRPSERLLHVDTGGASEQKVHDDDSTTIRSTDSSAHVVASPVTSPLHTGQAVEGAEPLAVMLPGQQSEVTTPSTVSTAPSTADDGSFGMDANTLERLALRMDYGAGEPSALYPQHHHRRVPSWEASPLQQPAHLYGSGAGADPMSPSLPPAYAQAGPNNNAWANNMHAARVASFRGEQEAGVGEAPNRFGYPPMGPNESRWQQQQQQQARYEGQGPFLPRPQGGNMDNRYYRPHQQPPGAYGPYQVGPRQHPNLPPVTPPRTVRNQRLPGGPGPSPNRPSPAHTPGGGMGQGGHTGSSSRSSSEILKTLLRKKACLYEPDPSRAVALVTWLVGRELALEFGFFTRQQLQAGVHACVAEKIDSGVITRTKVNRCMQIILNSCFHYIIPRPDGTEENGNTFRLSFAQEVSDDVALLRALPTPWNNLTVDRDLILIASTTEMDMKGGKKQATSAASTPQSSPQLVGLSGDKGSPRSPRAKDDGDYDGKRAVLLCFNENVRCAEDVFRSHNEFIRDTSHASNLQLSSQEWRAFFGKDAAGSPHLWGNVGIPVLCSEVRSQTDALGMMTMNELSKFRTTWCAKRYDHDHDLCGFAHIEVNGGWLRRSTTAHNYKDEMCPHVSKIGHKQRSNSKVYMMNECPHGVNCEFAHSLEELTYHPRRYKSRTCTSVSRPGAGCPLSDVCPGFHPAETYRFPSKKSEGRSGSRHTRQGSAGGAKGAGNPPTGAPVVFASPAPVSRFEEHLLLPGLQNLYRRHCSVVRAHVRDPNTCICCYSCFGDDIGVGVDLSSLSSKPTIRGLPQPRRS